MRRSFVVAALVGAACTSAASRDDTKPAGAEDAGTDAAAPGAQDGAAFDASPDGDAASGSTVTGEVVFEGDAGTTTVILAPETFDPDGFHEAAPSGPRATDVTRAWTIADVPAGTYVVLAGYERDGFVLDPSTPPAKVVVSGDPSETVTVAPGPKLVRALALVTIKPMSTAPAITVVDGEGEDAYVVSIVDMQGKTVLETNEPASATTGANVTFALDAGLAVPLRYRFRVTAKKNGVVTTHTEDLAAIRAAAPDDT